MTKEIKPSATCVMMPLDLYDAPEADAPAAQAKLAQKEGPQQQTRHQIGGDGG